MKTTKLPLLLVGLTAFSLAALTACHQDAPEEVTQQSLQETPPPPYYEGTIDFPIDGTCVLADEASEVAARAIEAKVDYRTNGQRRHSITLPASFPVVCILRSSGSDLPTYADATATKQGDHYTVQVERIKLRRGSTLAPKKKWYLMIVAGGTFDKQKGALQFQSSTGSESQSIPSGAATLQAGGRTFDIPFASPWVELPTLENGHPKWPKEWSKEERKRQKLTLYPQGVLCRATLRLDDSYKERLGNRNETLSISKLTVVSTSLSFAGNFLFTLDKLPSLSPLPTGTRPTLNWVPTQAQTKDKEFRALDASVPEYRQTFSATSGDLLSVKGGKGSQIFASNALPTVDKGKSLPAGVEAILFWAIPTERKDQLRTTLIAEAGSSTIGEKILPPQHTYIYGKQHPHQVGSGKSVYLDAVYYRPHTPLDYMAEYNLARKTPDQFKAGGKIPSGSSNTFATDHGVNAFAMLSQSEVKDVKISQGGRTYTSPSVAQWESVFPYLDGVSIGMDTGDAVTDRSVTVAVGKLQGKTTFSSRRVGNVVYALALSGLAGSQKHRVAYRYSYQHNPQAPASTQKLVIKQVLNANNVRENRRPYHNQKTTFEADGTDNPVQELIKIEAVPLGESFVGSVDDIAQEAFWTHAKGAIETRYLPNNYTSYHAYSQPSDLVKQSETKKFEAFLKKYKLNKQLLQHAYDFYWDHWGASANINKESPTFYFLQNDKLAGYSAQRHDWKSYSLEGLGHQFQYLRYPVRPFTKDER